MDKSLETKLDLMRKIARDGYEDDSTRSRPARCFRRIMKLIDSIDGKESLNES